MHYSTLTPDMAEILSHLSSLSPALHNLSGASDNDYDCQLRDLIAYLRQSLADKSSSTISEDHSFLDSIDPAVNSLSYLIILHFQVNTIRSKTSEQIRGVMRPGGQLWSKAIRFLRSFDPIQVRYAGEEWRHIVEFVGQSAQAVSKPLLAIRPIRDAMLRLDTSCAVFTSTHLLLIRLCLQAKEYAYVLPILDKHICNFPPDSEQAYANYHEPRLCAQDGPSTTYITRSTGLSDKISYCDYLRYFLYGAMVYMALKDWSKARHFLSIVISSPVTNSISLIMVEAYKKWILASLLGNGKLITPPPTITSHAMRVYRSLARPYLALARAFEEGDFHKLKSEVEIARSVWHVDNNAGLVSQVISAFHIFTILRLGKTFASITMVDVTERVICAMTTKEMEAFIASLIMTGPMKATLLHLQHCADPTMIRFLESTAVSSISQETEMRAQLVQTREMLKSFAVNIGGSNHGLELSNEHMESIQRSQKRVDSALKSSIGVVSESGGFDLDEDIMGDIG